MLDQALPEGTRIPGAWKADADTGTVADDWLKSFHDPVLNAIVAEAMANNLDLRQAADRVAVARQSAVVVGAQLLPQIGGQLGAKKTHDFGNEDEVGHTFSHTVASLGVAWELDVGAGCAPSVPPPRRVSRPPRSILPTRVNRWPRRWR